MKTFKKAAALLLALLLMLLLCACGEKDPEPVSPAEDDAPKVIATVNWGKAKASIVGAELYDDYGTSVLRLYYDYTNLAEDYDSGYNAIRMELTQNGEVLEEGYTSADDLADNAILSLQTNATVRAVAEYELLDESKIAVRLFDYDEVEADVNFELDPTALPGKPAEEFEIQKIADPKHTDGAPTSGTYRGDFEISIDGADVFEDDGEKAVRVNFTFTNNLDEPENMWFASHLVVYQDGIELKEITPSVELESDSNFNNDTEPGATVQASICFALRTDSPIEVALYEFDEVALGLEAAV